MNSENIKNITNQAIEQLIEALKVGKSEAFTSYLAAVAKFHRYSFQNILLIARQCPQAKAFDPAVLAAMKKMETTLDAMNACAPTVHHIN